MLLDLDDLERLANSLGFKASRQSADLLELKLSEGTTLIFENLTEDDDNVIGFARTPWHTHDSLCLEHEGKYYEFSPREVLSGLKSGELIVTARYLAGEPQDMWIDHVREIGQFEFYEPGEEFRVKRIG